MPIELGNVQKDLGVFFTHHELVPFNLCRAGVISEQPKAITRYHRTILRPKELFVLYLFLISIRKIFFMLSRSRKWQPRGGKKGLNHVT